ncbi:GerMN domain-containing protein [Nesterenkonia sp. E16_7]|uniref:GerMN domain-containing protein n=1 Tax=unclassified Nesterenkonia TaxID=2629769 RepID=UPI001A90E324|nr:MULTISPECIES: GerMN domain-containing protein [unclassified Nesterenkonia]MBO0596897.1 GerMN domain-containing protein [Nesterenkonia sp. E16_10]MBO0598149.1 GerMN domain-containing protein [Nesterenkonia sp. E16_7]
MTLTSRRRAYARLSAGCLGLAVLIVGCGSPDPAPEEPEAPSNAIQQPEVEADDSVRLPLAMVSPDGQAQAAPLDGNGTLEDEQAPGSPVEETPEGTAAQEIEIARTAPFGCDDTVSVVRSVPMVTEDPATAALEFLIDDQLSSHGSPAFLNPLAASEELSVESVEVEGDLVRVALSGEPVTEGECQSWQILTQIETTARVATGASSSEVTVDAEPLAELFGLPADREPLEILEVTR